MTTNRRECSSPEQNVISDNIRSTAPNIGLLPEQPKFNLTHNRSKAMEIIVGSVVAAAAAYAVYRAGKRLGSTKAYGVGFDRAKRRFGNK